MDMERQPTTHEFAFLKLMATSVAHLLLSRRRKLRFVTPYLVRHSHGQPTSLWLPDCDGPFEKYVNDCRGDSHHNNELWNKYHKHGRQRDVNVSIWNYILENCRSPDTDIQVNSTKVALVGNMDNEFRLDKNLSPTKKKSYNILVVTAYQSCRTLVAVMSFTVSSIDKKDIKTIREYLMRIKEGRYLRFFVDLNLPKIGHEIWHEMRLTKGINHWGESKELYEGLRRCDKEWCKELKRDYTDDYDEANVVDHSLGRPSINDVLSVKKEKGRLQRIIEQRVKAELSEYRGRTINYDIEVEVGKYDYMWFNALAVSDSIAAAIKGYSEILTEVGADRLYVNEWVSASGWIKCKVSGTKRYKATYILRVDIYEAGLQGKRAEIIRTANSLRSVCIPAFAAGAEEIFIDFLGEKNGSKRRTSIKIDNGLGMLKLNSVSISKPIALNPFTGIWYEIRGKISNNVIQLAAKHHKKVGLSR